jgi:hypothetical protein
MYFSIRNDACGERMLEARGPALAECSPQLHPVLQWLLRQAALETSATCCKVAANLALQNQQMLACYSSTSRQAIPGTFSDLIP